MSLIPCSVCGTSPPGKVATVISWWTDETGTRVAWKQKHCASCLIETVGSFLGGASKTSPHVTACPVCGRDSSTNLSPIYLNVYAPKRPMQEFALATDSSCATQLRERLLEGAERLRDRQGIARASALAIEPADDFAELPW